jgi:hypothetical protein
VSIFLQKFDEVLKRDESSDKDSNLGYAKIKKVAKF